MVIHENILESIDDLLRERDAVDQRVLTGSGLGMDDQPFFKWVLNTISTIPNAIGFAAALNIGVEAGAEQVGWLSNPNRILDPNQLVAARTRDLIGDKAFRDTMRANGFEEPWLDILFQISKELLSLGDIVQAENRGFLTPGRFQRLLREKGLDTETQEVVQKLRFIIPPVQDLITMMVREVFDPAVRATNQLDDNYPENATELLAQHGLDEQWARNYWASHWQLIGIRDAFEMMHRDEITMVELRALLVAKDIAPKFIDPLINISFKRFTRVDIRRMFNIGELTRVEVFAAYKELGYDDTKAEKLTKFAETLKDAKSPAIADELRGQTKANVIKGFKRGMLTFDESVEVLIALGIGEDAALSFMDNAVFEMDIEVRDLEVDLIEQEFRSGLIGEIEVDDRIDALQLPTTEARIIKLKLLRRRVEGQKPPAFTDLVKIAKAGALSRSEAQGALQELGFNTFWTDKMLLLLKGLT